MGSLQNDHIRLEQELQTEPYQVLLEMLRRSERSFRQFQAWSEMIAFMHAGSSRDPRKNDILKAILRRHSEDRDHRWRTILLVIFWPALTSMHWQKRKWDKEKAVLWQNVLWAFLQTVCRIDIKRRDYGLVQKLVNDTAHRLYREYRRKWDQEKLEEEYALEMHEALANSVDDKGIAAVELQMEQDAEIERLQLLERTGLISETDLHLIVGTRIYGKSLTESAEEVGLGYQAARKRRQRAEAKIRMDEKKS